MMMCLFFIQGWVQSYGSRYVRPPIIHGDVVFHKPMTVREFAVAQQLTTKPVKGMLTGRGWCLEQGRRDMGGISVSTAGDSGCRPCSALLIWMNTGSGRHLAGL